MIICILCQNASHEMLVGPISQMVFLFFYSFRSFSSHSSMLLTIRKSFTAFIEVSKLLYSLLLPIILIRNNYLILLFIRIFYHHLNIEGFLKLKLTVIQIYYLLYYLKYIYLCLYYNIILIVEDG